MNKYSQFIVKFLKLKKPTEKSLATAKAVLDKTSQAYYNTAQSLVTDEEWDKLLRHYEKFKKYGSGAKPTKGKKLVDVGHIFPELVGTLDKTNAVYKKDKTDKEQLSVEEWLESKGELTNYNAAITIKVDGNSVTGTFNDENKMELLLTRGKDGQGADLTSVFRNIDVKPIVSVPKGKRLGVKYEAVVLDKDFERAQEAIGKTFANARSMTAGILNSDDGYKYAEFLTLVPLRFQYDSTTLSRSKELKHIEKIKKDYEFPIKYIETKSAAMFLSKLQEIYTEFNKDLRGKMNFPIDGLVIEFTDEKVRKELGRDDDRNKFDVALKFPYMVKPSTVKEIKFYAGKSGRFTPVVVFDQVIFNGAECDHVSIANYRRFKELNLKVGSPVMIEYRNDVLSYLQPDPSRPEPEGKPIKFISKCPECGGKLSLNENKTFVNCRNTDCQINVSGKIVNWFTKLNIKGVKENIVQDLVDNELVTKIVDLYSLEVEDIVKIEGYQLKSAINIINAIHSKKEMFDWEFFGSLGIEGVGRKTFKLISEAGHHLITFLDNKNFDSPTVTKKLCKIKGINEKTATAIQKYISENRTDLIILNGRIKVHSYAMKLQELKNSSEGIEPKNLVFTGFRDPELQSKLEGLGHSIKGSVSSTTDMLVVKTKGSGSSKETKAQELGKPIYSLEEFKLNILQTLI